MAKLDARAEARALAEADLEAFISLVHPKRMLGGIHKDVCRWWTREGHKSHQLLLLPRDHQKSALVAYRVAWEITRRPDIRVLYISATANLAEKQLKFIKDILTSDRYRFYWPEMVNPEESKREKWTSSEISVDHPKRKEEAIRDSTIFTGGLTTSLTGLHCDIAVCDDVVVYENAYTEDGRDKVETQYSLLASIAGTDGELWVVGTRYHPKDLYQTMMDSEVEIFDEETGELIESTSLYEVKEHTVETRGDGTGEFLWPRQRRSDGKWYGFDQNILAKKKAQYKDVIQFRAQYYNDPNDPTGGAIPSELFQYYKRETLSRGDGFWFVNGKRVNVFAAVDFAFSLSRRADYTAVVVVGIDRDHNYYVLDIDRFRTDKISDYFEHILKLHQKWGFTKIRAEVTVAQQAIVKSLKDDYIRQHGLSLSVDEFRPTRVEGSKAERVEAILQPKYANRQMWHYMGGNCQILEEELIMTHPPHDDVKDCLASAVDICVAPTSYGQMTQNTQYRNFVKQHTHTRFGGMA